MPSCSRGEVIVVRYPFSDLTSSKVRPAVVVSAPHPSHDLLIVPLTSRTSGLLPGEFVLADWAAAGLNVSSAVKRGIFTIHESLVSRVLQRLSAGDLGRLDASLCDWLDLP